MPKSQLGGILYIFPPRLIVLYLVVSDMRYGNQNQSEI